MAIEPVSVALTLGSALWDALAPQVVENAADSAKNKWKRLNWAKSESAYKRRLIDLYSSTKLLGNPKPIQLDRIYTDVFVLDQITAYRRLQIDEKSGSLRESTGLPPKIIRKPLLEIVRDRVRVYVLGKPGAGKSTFLKTLCLLCCKGEIPRTPVFISLKEWHDSGMSLEQFIRDEFRVCGFPNSELFAEHLLSTGNAMLLLDGLDEVPPENDARQKAITALTRLSRQYPTAQMILTCRIAAAEYSFDQFDYFEIADFTEEQQLDFVSKWYATAESARQRFLAQWAHSDNEGLRDLARTPLLLALLCLAFDETLSFPKRRVELYQEATNALLRKWDASRGIRRDDLYKTLSYIRREQLLGRVAAKTFLKSEVFFPVQRATDIIDEYLDQLPPRDASKTTDAIDLLKAVEAQHGLLVERAIGIYSFSHLTLHEYFAARNLVETAHTGVLHTAIQEHFFEDSWREVFLMAASLMDDATPLFDGVRDLFQSRYFNFPPLRRIFERSRTHSGTFFTTVASGSTPRHALTGVPENQVAHLVKCKDLCVTLAAQFHFIKCGEFARARVRQASAQIQSLAFTEARASDAPIKTLRTINDYLQASTVIIESLQIASLANRDAVVESLVFPTDVG
jgi:predicted NACHT family NTPase